MLDGASKRLESRFPEWMTDRSCLIFIIVALVVLPCRKLEREGRGSSA